MTATDSPVTNRARQFVPKINSLVHYVLDVGPNRGQHRSAIVLEVEDRPLGAQSPLTLVVFVKPTDGFGHDRSTIYREHVVYDGNVVTEKILGTWHDVATGQTMGSTLTGLHLPPALTEGDILAGLAASSDALGSLGGLVESSFGNGAGWSTAPFCDTTVAVAPPLIPAPIRPVPITLASGAPVGSLTVVAADASAAPVATPHLLVIRSGAHAGGQLTVAMSGLPAPTYQWYESAVGSGDWSAITGATSSSYTPSGSSVTVAVAISDTNLVGVKRVSAVSCDAPALSTLSNKRIVINKPAGAPSGYAAHYKVGGGSEQTVTSFPTTLTMATNSQNLESWGACTDYLPSYHQNDNWNEFNL